MCTSGISKLYSPHFAAWQNKEYITCLYKLPADPCLPEYSGVIAHLRHDADQIPPRATDIITPTAHRRAHYYCLQRLYNIYDGKPEYPLDVQYRSAVTDPSGCVSWQQGSGIAPHST